MRPLDCLTGDEKAVFRTAFEIDQRWLIEHAAERAGAICQSQSLNVFLPADVHKRDLHRIHLLAWQKGVKSLYYCRSKSIQRAESVTHPAASEAVATVPHLGPVNGGEQLAADSEIDYDECLSCQ